MSAGSRPSVRKSVRCKLFIITSTRSSEGSYSLAFYRTSLIRVTVAILSVGNWMLGDKIKHRAIQYSILSEVDAEDS